MGSKSVVVRVGLVKQLQHVILRKLSRQASIKKQSHAQRQKLLSDLKFCGEQRNLQLGRTIHANVVKTEKVEDVYVVNELINMYCKCGSMDDARTMFESIQEPNVVHWTTMLLGYAEKRQPHVALDLFSRMKECKCQPNSRTYVAALKACISLAVNGGASGKIDCFEQGRKIHLEIGSDWNHYVLGTLIDMYSKCGRMVDARDVFDRIQLPNVVQWNTLILGYVENEEAPVALIMFRRMKEAGCSPTSVTYLAALKACTSLAVYRNDDRNVDCVKLGRSIHSEIGHHLNQNVQGALIEMYSKCGSMVHARGVFDGMNNPDLASWNALLLGYADNGEGKTALDLFFRIRASGHAPDSFTYVAVLRACGSIGALAFGRKLHLEINEFTPHVLTCLVDFYAKCGLMGEARRVFDTHKKVRDVTTWTALLAGYGAFGDSNSAFDLFKSMQDEGVKPNGVTLVCLLLCCSHAGLVEKAREYFEAMPVKYGITPTVIHYTCMVDILGRGNQLDQAIRIIREMPCTANAVTWTTLLCACRKWKNVEIGREAFQALVDMGKQDASSYVLMNQLYGTGGGMSMPAKRLPEEPSAADTLQRVQCGSARKI